MLINQRNLHKKTESGIYIIKNDRQNIYRIDAHMSEEYTQKKLDLYLNYSLRKSCFPLNLTDRRTDIIIHRVASLLKIWGIYIKNCSFNLEHISGFNRRFTKKEEQNFFEVNNFFSLCYVTSLKIIQLSIQTFTRSYLIRHVK